MDWGTKNTARRQIEPRQLVDSVISNRFFHWRIWSNDRQVMDSWLRINWEVFSYSLFICQHVIRVLCLRWIISTSSLSSSCCDCLAHMCRRKKELKARTVWLGCPEKCEEKYPKNAIKNQKYNIFTFVPGVS